MSRPRLIKENSAPLSLAREQLIRIHDLMVKARVLEERLIQMYKQGHGYFWIGGPGEEAFNVPLGLLMKVGEGLDYDYLHAHYRQSATLLAMGEEPIGALRQMKNTATDPYSGGRNFAGHFTRRSKNIAPITSPIEVQYSIAPGTAMAQKRHGGDAITIVTGGDAGTAEGDFPTCLVWSSRPANPLPILIIVTNNKWGISTTADGQHGETNISDRARAFNIPAKTINGNDPVESYQELQAAMEYVRKERKPYFIEARVSRLYGHSSASGANFVNEEQDCLRLFEARLEQEGVLSREQMEEVRNRYSEELAAAARTVRDEPQPSGDTIWDHIYAEKK
ncbi:thiamine pyrophosphate-dependent dehydrogenase E1 component subunit alpha [Corallococcus praedator]|uniref:2-oxoisovalerate dehydrogenase subunit alpha n=1 Tax=Corallococcus praedator TaxID=2316724 RepID=A0ABX9QLN9_9BACT|nr:MULTISPECIES: thiamine pyrophosphate-dependent dehydrogenase E1 component subunit alpha [Corallococcus]RKH17934.1 thiamine pyrophosphate-dependent dehydrogenase E1 component subunit alpha [Corallococcus sp. CA047B]RKH36307.1 thiamine pyrophosphate-dependent dehydrogenase E1 component subunit alpha [Corallococcus sp. CA031C]RKI12556.1 thiamine pyrophosphate-dependent dehydrogenase E1 component subunit alpha [Corallococcus praedator]